MSWFCLDPPFGSGPNTNPIEPALGLDWTLLAAAPRGETLVFAACFEKEPENQLKESGKRSLVHHKVVELLTLLRTINAAVPDTLFLFLFFYTPSPSTLPPSPYLPHLESIKELWEEGKNLSTGNVFTMPGKARGTPFKRLKHPCRIFWGLFLFFGGKFHEPLNQSFSRLANTNPPVLLFFFPSMEPCIAVVVPALGAYGKGVLSYFRDKP